MKKIIRKIRDNIFIFILGGIICSAIVVLADTITSSMVIYDNTTSHSSYTTVQGALDNLYNIAIPYTNTMSIILHQPRGFNAEFEAGLMRYQGTSAQVDNYICFGTTDKNTCTTTPGTYMYRIIGIDENGQMKLIKNTSIGNNQWNSSNGVTWPNSSLKAGLNGSYFLTNTTYVPDSTWSDRIADVDWHYWIGDNANISAADMATAELGAATTNAKIGLMYAHDYYYGLPGGNNCSALGAYDTCKTSWLFLSSAEWTISRYSNNSAWRVTSSGSMSGNSMTTSNSVHPVFYLTSSQVINEGTGTLADPYVLR